jgi:hypothetical protein
VVNSVVGLKTVGSFLAVALTVPLESTTVAVVLVPLALTVVAPISRVAVALACVPVAVSVVAP